jgi:hypothetical protein
MQPIYVERPIPSDGQARKPASRAAPLPRSVQVNLAESPLGWLRARGFVSERLFCAGENLRTDYDQAGLSACITMVWDAAPSGRTGRSGNEAEQETHAQIDAKRRFEGAISHAGPCFTDILWRVVCACEPLPQIEERFGWPKRSARVVLSLALDRVADYYCIQ